MKTKFTYDENILSDLHKDAYGFRPGESFYASWKAMTPSQKQKEWDSLCSALDASIKEEEAAFAVAKEEFEAAISNLIATGANDRQTAIRWLAASENEEIECEQDADFFCYKMGLKYECAKEVLAACIGAQ